MNDLYTQLGARIRQARDQQQMTQEALASRCGLTRGSVANLEAGRQRPPLHTLIAIGRVLQVSLAELLAEGDAPDAPLPSPVRHVARHTYLSPHQMQRLNLACLPIRDAFGDPPYLVGSVLKRATFRDVDVRTILAAEEFEQWFGPVDKDGGAHSNPLWVLICSAISEWLSSVSGLPVDYQIQRRTEANEAHPGPLSALTISMPWTGGAR